VTDGVFVSAVGIREPFSQNMLKWENLCKV
jgi:hypothetical protein